MPIPNLPFDIILAIFNHLVYEGAEGAESLARCMRASSLLNAAASNSLLWEQLYRARYIHSLQSAEASRLAEHSGDYRLMYAARRSFDLHVLALLHKIIYDRVNRRTNANQLADLSWDAWDILQHEASLPLPAIFSTEPQDHSPQDVKPGAITRRFWANRLLQIIGRRYAAQVWNRLLRHDPEVDTELCELSLNAISCFFGFSPFVIAKALDELAEDCKSYISGFILTLNMEDPKYNPVAICQAICAFMRVQGFRAVGSDRFRVIGNSLPHHYIFKSRATIPISLVHVFVAISRRIGLPASHVNFPNRILARVSFPNPEMEDLYIDVYESSVIKRSEMSTLVEHLHMTLSQFETTILEAPSFAMLTRAMRNIMCCNPLDGAITDRTAMYCAQFPVILMRPQSSIHVLSCIDDPALEVGAFLLPTVSPLLQAEQREAFHLVCEGVLHEDQVSAGKVKRHSELTSEVKYRVGLFFKHAKYGYTGLIYGWDHKCSAADQWVRAMGVNSLPRGKEQPFYYVLRMEGSETYVAEENIIPTQPTAEVIRKFHANHTSLGRYFSDVEIVDAVSSNWGQESEIHLGTSACEETPVRPQRLGRMIPSPELHRQYPEDFKLHEPYEYYVVDV